jgi:cobyrinic acid a,c-diamide synthase
MTSIPRLALATPATGTEPSPAALAWLAGLTGRQRRVQHFRSRACPTGNGLVGQVAGLPGRHLDSWLMPGPVLRRIFARGARQADLALVEGTLDDHPAPLARPHFDQPGLLRPLVEGLDLPTVAVLPCARRDGLHLPRIPDGVDAVFLDDLAGPEDFEVFRRLVRCTWRKPVVGGVEAIPELRAALGEAAQGRPLPDELVARLAASFLKFADLGAIRALSRSRPVASDCDGPSPCGRRRFRVAYAQDEAFGAYFPDTLEALEALGADLVEFSPLGDEALPERVDLVMIGCGFPDLHADALAENQSLIGALRHHVCRGHRIYSEGGGTAYLGRSMTLADGRVVPGAGILPFDAVLRHDPPPPSPVTRTLARDSWLGPRGTVVRGYRANRWRLVPGADPLDCPSCFGALTAQGDVYYHHHAVGGLIHLHLGALPEVVAAFAGPHSPSLSLPSARPCP